MPRSSRQEMGRGFWDPLLGVNPAVELAWRHGITDNFEIGVKAWPVGLEVEGKVALRRPPIGPGSVDLAISPRVSGSFIMTLNSDVFGEFLVLRFGSPLLVGLNLSTKTVR